MEEDFDILGIEDALENS